MEAPEGLGRYPRPELIGPLLTHLPAAYLLDTTVLLHWTRGKSQAATIEQQFQLTQVAQAHLLTMDKDFLPLRGRAGWSVTVLDERTALPVP